MAFFYGKDRNLLSGPGLILVVNYWHLHKVQMGSGGEDESRRGESKKESYRVGRQTKPPISNATVLWWIIWKKSQSLSEQMDPFIHPSIHPSSVSYLPDIHPEQQSTAWKEGTWELELASITGRYCLLLRVQIQGGKSRVYVSIKQA